MLRGVIYARVSTQEQADSRLGLESQGRLCREYAERNGIELVAAPVVDAGVSGSIPIGEREAGRIVIELATAEEIDVVVALDQDRVFRNALDGLVTVERLRETGVTLHLVDGGPVGTSPDEWLAFAIRAVIGQFSCLQSRQRTKRALKAAKDLGKHVGATPYGFTAAVSFDAAGKKVDSGKLVRHEEEQALIRRIHWLSQRHSNAAIARLLNEEGVATKRGGRWTHVQVGDILRRKEAADGREA